MPLKPLTASQKKVLDAVVRLHFYEAAEKNVPGLQRFKSHVLKDDPVAAQAERYLKKSAEKYKGGLAAEIRRAAEGKQHG